MGQKLTSEKAAILTFQPDSTFPDNASFTHTPTDNNGADFTPATVTIPVTAPPNNPPVANNKTAPSIANNASTTVSLNATDAAGTVADFTISTLPPSSQGILLLNREPMSAGQKLTPEKAEILTFQPHSTFPDNASFTHTATDNNGADSTPATVTIPVTAPPNPGAANLRLVKRITRINSTTFNDLANDPADPDDRAPGWPSNYLQGKIDGGKIQPGDEIEYTIYFLSDGGATANNVTICDLVPRNLTFIPGGISVFVNGSQLSYTDAADGDGGQFYPAGTSLPVSCGGANTNGAVVVNLGNIPSATGSTPSNSYGFVRFRAKFER